MESVKATSFNGNGGMWCVAWNGRRAAFFWVIEVAVEMETPSSLGKFAVSSIGCKYVQESFKDTSFNDNRGMWCVALEWEESCIFLIRGSSDGNPLPMKLCGVQW